jgi:hypothetical protein
MGVRWTLAVVSLAVVGLPRAWCAEPAKAAVAVTFEGQVKPFLANYCTTCHGGTKPRAGLNLETIPNEAAVANNPKLWKEVARLLRGHEMPPPRRRNRPSDDEIAAITAWIDARVKATSFAKHDPGHVTIRRLNRAEYNNTIRDLVGVDFHPAEDFPADDVGNGFDNIGDVLSIPPILMEKYLAAAEKIVNKAFATPEIRKRLLNGLTGGSNARSGAYRVLEPFARRAYRRPVTRQEMKRLVEFVELADNNGDGIEAGIKLAMQAILVSPNFLFRVELDPEPGNPKAVRTLNDYELATRLSYFLWSSMPDDELFAVVRKGVLRQGDNLEKQVRRMLKDPKSHALVENFADQWLQIRNLKTVSPDTGQFPSFNEKLRADMAKETELFFEYVMHEDRSILEFLDADYTFLNERLAKHYGIAGVQGESFRKVSLRDSPRGGVLTQASILTITSNPTRTSPVKRGKWILENILGTPPPPPPPDAGELSEDKDVVLSGSLRRRMEQHRANPNCASCHERMDPLGFGFENFDAVGAWRVKDGKFPIDSSGVLPSGQKFRGPKELKAILKTKEGEFRHCLTEKMLTYALGRGLEDSDAWAVDEIANAVARNGNKFSSLVMEIVKSDPFQKRRGKRGNP